MLLRSLILAAMSFGCVSSCVSSNEQDVETDSPVVSAQTPELFSPNVGTLKISGDAVFIRTHDDGMSLGVVSGTVGSSGQASTFKGPLFTVRDSDGPNAREELYDGSVRIRTAGDEFKFARFYITENDSGASVGVFGSPTTQSLPNKGSAKFVGIGQISEVRRGFTIPTDQSATSRVEVNFGTSKVNASLDVPPNSQSLLSNVDKIVARGLLIDGGRFSGSGVRVFKDKLRVNPTGANSTAGAAGRFYGPDGQEVGGVMHISGDNGVITGIFIAE
ncbi:MAG: transferrin-binding protein-like solute binding protein [Planktotalea sp.]|uniref:transferrin-binding protein-like solute binding protein n=1 Tax=Planktotalea sp. TaxID=2029877 RepID=UPI00260D1DC4|nr:transferrin-binding protein-like solute binding protein [Planktotalea sp.]MDG1084497.1 transferrin-binding protein-like solute binding protein [Planktotalea sp.]